MPTNDFKPFAIGAGAHVTSQADWLALAALASGFQSGKASSAQINKALRQALFISSALAQYTADKSEQDVLDDGDVAGFVTKMHAAFGKDFQPLDATLTALAALTGAANKLPYFNGDDTATLTDLTTVGRNVIGQTSVANLLTYLGLVDTDKLKGRLLSPPIVYATSQQLTMPASGNLFRLRLVGGGGGSGSAGATSSAQLAASGGGGSGSYVELWLTRDQLQALFTAAGGTIQLTIGAGGNGGVVSAGATGGVTSFGSFIICPGGIGSGHAAPVSGSSTSLWGGGGPGAAPTISIPGLPTAQIISSFPGTSATYGITLNGPTLSGNGADSPLGHGGTGSGGTPQATPGTGFGAGAGGAANATSSAAKNGAGGSQGVFILEIFA